MSTPVRILITGSRHWSELHTVEVALRQAYLDHGGLQRGAIVVHGGANGADACAAILAPRMGMRAESHPADWRAHGRGAGPKRNQAMVDAGADVCLTFPLPNSVADLSTHNGG